MHQFLKEPRMGLVACHWAAPPNVIHLEVHDEPLVSFIVSSRLVLDKRGVTCAESNPPHHL